jgi:hypothetical protein
LSRASRSSLLTLVFRNQQMSPDPKSLRERGQPRTPVVPEARVSDATGTPARPPVFSVNKNGELEGRPLDRVVEPAPDLIRGREPYSRSECH